MGRDGRGASTRLADPDLNLYAPRMYGDVTRELDTSRPMRLGAAPIVPGEAVLTWSHSDGTLLARLPEVDIHRAVVVE
jgi:hypothetical protein